MNKGKIASKSIYLLIILIILSAIIFYVWLSIRIDLSESPPGVLYGDVYGEFTPSGIIYSNEEYAGEKFFLWIYDAEDNQSSSFFLRIWNISEIKIGDKSEGVFHYTNYTLNNESLIIEGPQCYFLSLFKHGTVDIEYSELSAKNDDGLFLLSYNFSSVRGSAVLDHKSGSHLDFQLFYSQVRIGNDTLSLEQGSFGFPADEYANIEFIAKGHGRINPVPTFIINGSLVITDFRETTSEFKGVRNHDRIAWSSNNITVITKREPICTIIRHQDYEIIQPWSIEVREEESY